MVISMRRSLHSMHWVSSQRSASCVFVPGLSTHIRIITVTLVAIDSYLRERAADEGLWCWLGGCGGVVLGLWCWLAGCGGVVFGVGWLWWCGVW
jgi:hypothetical protein